MLNIALREAERDDIPYIINTWLKNYRTNATNHMINSMPHNEYDRRQKNTIKSILTLPQTRILIAYIPNIDADNYPIGFLVYQSSPNQQVHYVYVRKEYQQQGVATQLLTILDTSKPILFSHKTRIVNQLILNESWEHAPWLAFGVK